MRTDSNYITTISGQKVWPMDPRPEDFRISDIVWSLSKIVRWNGHARHTFTVGQHSLMAWVMLNHDAPACVQYATLLHDASEAYFGDLPKPIKDQMPQYAAAENRVQKMLAETFCFPYPFDVRVHDVDRLARIWEDDFLRGGTRWTIPFFDLDEAEVRDRLMVEIANHAPCRLDLTRYGWPS